MWPTHLTFKPKSSIFKRFIINFYLILHLKLDKINLFYTIGQDLFSLRSVKMQFLEENYLPSLAMFSVTICMLSAISLSRWDFWMYCCGLDPSRVMTTSPYSFTILRMSSSCQQRVPVKWIKIKWVKRKSQSKILYIIQKLN